MKKIQMLLWYIFLIFMIMNSLWLSSKINFIFYAIMTILDLIIFFKLPKGKRKLDIVDGILGILPIMYVLPYVLGNNVLPFKQMLSELGFEFSITLTLLVLRRFFDEEKVNTLFTTIVGTSTIYFFVSFAFQVWPIKMMLLGIFSNFGDTYINSIYRFYGTLKYCNASALFFIISCFILLFKIENDKESTNLYLGLLFINFLGFLTTFSKMVSIYFVLVLITLIVYLIVRKKYKFLRLTINIVMAIIIPSLIGVSIYRSFLINLNIISFILELIIIAAIFILLFYLFIWIFDKSKVIYSIIGGVIVLGVVFLTVKPISIGLNVNNVLGKNNTIISDFILEKGKNVEITLDNTIKNGSSVKVSLVKFVEEDDHHTKSVVVETSEVKPKVKFNIVAEKSEYYYIRLENIDRGTNIKINNLKINGKEYLINSFLVPYQYIHQLDLTKYDKESVSHRFWYYKDALKIMQKENFIFGRGFHSFSYYAEKNNFNYLENDPHSYLFQLWLDVGIYGVIYVILLIVFGIKYMIEKRENDDSVIWFCFFSLCMLMVPFDCIYSISFMKLLLMLSFVGLYGFEKFREDDNKKKQKYKIK